MVASTTSTGTIVLLFILQAGLCLGQECKEVPNKKDPSNCGEYYLCPNNRPTQMQCSTGLAYNYDKQMCDWPDLVEDCDVEEFLNFNCPEAASFDTPGSNQAFAHPEDCAKQLVCVQSAFEDYKRVPRLLSCDYPQVFNPEIGQCDYYKEVKGCEKYYDERRKQIAAVKATSEIEAGAIPDERRVSRNPTARPVPEIRRKASSRKNSTRTTTTTSEPPTTDGDSDYEEDQ